MTEESSGTREVCNMCNSIWNFISDLCPECGSGDTEDWHDTLCECDECKAGKRAKETFDVIQYAKDELKRRSLAEASKHIGFDIEERIKELEAAMQKAIPILEKKAWHLNMEFFTASGKVLGDMANEFKQLIKK